MLQVPVGLGAGEMLAGSEHRPERRGPLQSVEAEHLDRLHDVEPLAVGTLVGRAAAAVDHLTCGRVVQAQMLGPALASTGQRVEVVPRGGNSLMQIKSAARGAGEDRCGGARSSGPRADVHVRWGWEDQRAGSTLDHGYAPANPTWVGASEPVGWQPGRLVYFWSRHAHALREAIGVGLTLGGELLQVEASTFSERVAEGDVTLGGNLLQASFLVWVEPQRQELHRLTDRHLGPPFDHGPQPYTRAQTERPRPTSRKCAPPVGPVKVGPAAPAAPAPVGALLTGSPAGGFRGDRRSGRDAWGNDEAGGGLAAAAEALSARGGGRGAQTEQVR